MGTAVLHPQDCLPRARARSHSKRCFPFPSDFGTVRPVPVCHTAVDAAIATAANGGICSHRDASAGLLPLPDHVSPIASPSGRKPAALFSQILYKRCTAAKPIQRRSFSSNDIALHGRRQATCGELGTAAHSGLPPCKATAARRLYAHPSVAPNAKTHFSHLHDGALLKWSEHHQVKLRSYASQPVSHASIGDRTKQFFNVAVDVVPQSACKSSKRLSRMLGANRQLRRSPACKTHCGRGTPPPMFCSVQIAKNLVTSLSDMSERGEMHGCGSPETSSEGSSCGRSPEKIAPPSSSVPLTGVARSTPPQAVDNAGRVEVGLRRPYSVVEFKTVERCSSLDSSDQDAASEGHVKRIPQVLISRSSTLSNSTNFNWCCETKDVLGCLNSAYDPNGLLPIVDERWAGPSFSNSPPPSSLPVPKFLFNLPKTMSISPQQLHNTAPLFLDGPLPEAKRIRDIAFATKNLRRLLHLNYAGVDP